MSNLLSGTITSKILTLSFIIFVLVIVGTYAWVCFTGMYDAPDSPINAERFNQIWTSLAGIVGAIVGWLIREVSSGQEREAFVSGERARASAGEIPNLKEIHMLNTKLREAEQEKFNLTASMRDKEIALERAEQELSVLNAIKTKVSE